MRPGCTKDTIIVNIIPSIINPEIINRLSRLISIPPFYLHSTNLVITNNNQQLVNSI
jgi:hypothetical protein